jgi:CobQ-like glutamine amidotransferase family enzyme
MKKLTIGHLYPKLLNIYGDGGNIITLKKRAEWRGFEVETDEINSGDFQIKEHDIYFIGGGQDLQQIEVSKELQKHKEFLLSERERGAVFLGICGGYQLLGHYYQPLEGDRLLGISLLDAYTVAGKKRFIGNVTVNTEYNFSPTLVGFENHSGLTYLQGETKALGIVAAGNGNNGQDKTEGARYKNVFGTYLHGSFLPKNVKFADYLLELALGEKLTELDDEIETNAHNALIGKI